MEFYKTNKDKIKMFFIILLIFLGIYIFIKFTLRLIWPFVFAFILSIILEPLALILTNKLKLMRGISAIISILFLIFIIGFLGTKLVIKVNDEIVALAKSFDPIYIENTVENLKYKLDNMVLPLNFPYTDQVYSFIIDTVPKMFSPPKDFTPISSVSRFLAGFVISIIATFFFIKDKLIIRKWIKEKSAGSFKNILLVKESLGLALGAYIKAQLILMCITCVICLIGFLSIKLPYAVVGSFVVAVVDAVPLFGSGLFLLPAVIYSIIMGEYSGAIIFAVMYLSIFLSRQIVEPKVISKKIGVHPLVALISIYLGLLIFGILGFILGPITVIVIKTSYEILSTEQ